MATLLSSSTCTALLLYSCCTASNPGVPQAQGLGLAGGFRDLGSMGLADLEAPQ